MKTMRKTISLLLAALMLLSLGAAAYAVDGDDAPAAIGTSTYTNVPNYDPDLYIKKVVVCSDPNVEIPEQQFRFTLTVGGAAYAGESYVVYNEKNEQIRPVPGEKQEKPLKTGSHGEFYLANGETAFFPYVGTSEYVIKEDAPKDSRFSYDDPDTGILSGTVAPKGTSVTMQNRFTPPEPEREYGSLFVEKRISMPSPYKYAGDEVFFDFILKVDDEPAKSEAFTITKADGSTLTGTTDSTGKFSVPAGGKAAFRGLIANADYEITEVESDGWRLSSATNTVGSTSAGNTAYFNNMLASFIVTKSVNGAYNDEEFTFELLNSNKAQWANVEYYLYNTDGTRVKEGDEYISHKTDAEGKFTLKKNQAAMFVGIPVGTVYSVHEMPIKGFEQIRPADINGYVGKQVSASGAEILGFENQPVDLLGTLRITKHLVIDKDAPLTNESFTFVLEKLNEETKAYAPAVNKPYTIDSDSTRYLTNKEDGSFKVQANQTINFSALVTGTYRVRELTDSLPAGYKVTPNTESEQVAVLEEDGAQLEFSNSYEAKKLAMKLFKFYGDKTALSGAEFSIFTDVDCKNSFVTEVVDGVSVPKVYTTGSDGYVTITGLREGVYYLKEVKAPEGFAVIPGTVELKIDRVFKNGIETYTVKATSHLQKVTVTAGEVQIVNNESVLELSINDDEAKIYALPSTGGIGTGLFSVIGIAIMAAMTFLFVKEKKKED